MAHLLNALQAHLAVAGIVRKPGDAGAAHPMWLEPALGVPAPGESQGVLDDPNLVLGAFLATGVPPDPYGSWIRKPIVDVQFRAARDRAYYAEDVELQVTKALIDKRDFMLGTGPSQMYVVECEQWRALQRLGSDEQGTEFVTSYIFELLRA